MECMLPQDQTRSMSVPGASWASRSFASTDGSRSQGRRSARLRGGAGPETAYGFIVESFIGKVEYIKSIDRVQRRYAPGASW